MLNSHQRFIGWILIGFLAIAMARPTAAQSDQDVVDSIKGLLEDGGFDPDSLPDILVTHDTGRPEGFYGIDDQGRVLVLNFGLIKGWIDQIRDNSGYILPLDSPFVLGFLLYVAIHELQHDACCHDGSGNTLADRCREALADINGANATCDFIEALLASLTGPPSEFMLTLLHLLCANIQDERDKYNTAWGRSEAAGCKGWSDGEEANGGSGGCQCTSSSWDPPKPDPCGGCPDYPDPGSDPAHPYGDGDVIPPCDACDNI